MTNCTPAFRNGRGAIPRSVVVITVEEVYSQCARAVLRADLWNPAEASRSGRQLPSVGQMLASAKKGFDGEPTTRNGPAARRRPCGES